MNLMRKEKVGRNDPCPCGSGGKYKKCCLGYDDPSQTSFVEKPPFAFDWEQEDELTPVMTTTCEPHMAVRLYYDVLDKNALLNQLEKLRCVSWESEDRFLINYFKEAKSIGLSTPHNKVPKNLYPIILAEGHIVDETHLHLDLRSFDRAVCMVEFINKWISRTAAKVTHAASYNELSRTDKNTIDSLMSLDFDEIFSEEKMVVIDPQVRLQKLKSAIATVDSEEEKMEIIVNLLDDVVNDDFSLVEKFPLYYYEEGINSIISALKFRIVVAIERWKGNENCKPFDVFQKMFVNMMNSEDENWN